MLLPEVIKNDALQKATLVHQFTNNWEKRSVKDLTFVQANHLIMRFGGVPVKYEHWAYFDAKKAQHRYILSLLLQLGWSNYNESQNRHIADLYRFSEWLKSNKSPVQMPLKKMNKQEVSKIIVALSNMAS
jgi:hypothetical protein